MSPQHSKELEDVEDINDNPGYDLSVLLKEPPKLPYEPQQTVNFTYICRSYIWHVHREPIVDKSNVFEIMTSLRFKVQSLCFASHVVDTDFTGQEGQEQTIDLPEDEPELIARLIQFCYFGTTHSVRQRHLMEVRMQRLLREC